MRVGFRGGGEIWTKDVLNLGVSPAKLVELMRRKLEAAGGKLFENEALQGVPVGDGAGSREEIAKKSDGILRLACVCWQRGESGGAGTSISISFILLV